MYTPARQNFYIFSYENNFSLLKLLTEREVIRGHSWIEKKKGIMQARADIDKQSSKFVLTSGSMHPISILSLYINIDIAIVTHVIALF